MEPFSYDEYADVMLMFGECLRNATRECDILCSHRRHPFHHISSVLERGYRTTNFPALSPLSEGQVGQVDLKDTRVKHFQTYRRTSIRRASNGLGSTSNFINT